MKFKVLESVLTGLKRPYGIVYIYKNPTSQELRDPQQSIGNRGFIDPKGDLYIEAYWSEKEEPYSWIIHGTLLGELHMLGLFKKVDSLDWYKNEDDIKYGVGVQRRFGTMDFYLAESYKHFIFDSKENRNLVNEMFRLAKSKNPHLVFHGDNILGNWNEEDEGEEL